jgi:hypothetical protein
MNIVAGDIIVEGRITGYENVVWQNQTSITGDLARPYSSIRGMRTPAEILSIVIRGHTLSSKKTRVRFGGTVRGKIITLMRNVQN